MSVVLKNDDDDDDDDDRGSTFPDFLSVSKVLYDIQFKKNCYCSCTKGMRVYAPWAPSTKMSRIWGGCSISSKIWPERELCPSLDFFRILGLEIA